MKNIIGAVCLLMVSLVLMPLEVIGGPLTLAWEDLVPENGAGEPVLIPPDQEIFGLPDRKNFDGNDDDYAFLIESMETLRYQQPPGAYIRPELDGKNVRIPGYITPLSFADEKLREFLLVPYHGACIHRPPPPGNQIVFVAEASGIVEERLYQPVWITGILRAKPVGTAVADVGYSLENAAAAPYDSVKEQSNR
jgi:hypothetical protein